MGRKIVLLLSVVSFLLSGNKKIISSLSHSNKQALQRRRPLLIPHSPLSYSHITCRPLGSPRHSRTKDKVNGPYDRLASYQVSFVMMGTCVNYYSVLSTLMTEIELISERTKNTEPSG